MNRFYKTGVYFIIHRASGRAYIGSAVDIYSRWTVHRCVLRKGVHHSVHLQRVWDKYGESEFKFVIVEECEVEVLLEVEQSYLDTYPKDKLLNTSPVAGSTLGLEHTEETKKILSDLQKEIADSPDERARRSNRVYNQHKEGRIGKPRKPIRDRICITCKERFQPRLIPSGLVSQSNYCNDCRPPHYGGRYTYARSNAPRKSRKCSRCETEFINGRLPNGKQASFRLCPDCRGVKEENE